MRRTLSINVHPATISYWVSRSYAYAMRVLFEKYRLSSHERRTVYSSLHNYYAHIPPEIFAQSVMEMYMQCTNKIDFANYLMSRGNIPNPAMIFDNQNHYGVCYIRPLDWHICLN